MFPPPPSPTPMPTPSPPPTPPPTDDSPVQRLGGPPWFVLDIPRPPSVNRFLAKLGNQSPAVRKWLKQADAFLRAKGKYPRIIGPYELWVTFPVAEFGQYDADNHVKALSDWLQRVEIIENDRKARWICLMWGEAPEGCRMRVRPWMEQA